MGLIEKILQGDQKAAAKLISKIEDEPTSALEELKVLKERIVPVHTLGITGPPGVGKSTLIARLIERYREKNKKVGVLAIDPSSPFTGGALLGDRIRMQMHSPDEGVFIRSMATRGQLGGLSRATAKAVKVLTGWGADVVVVETVGVGQDEVEVMRVADTIVVVLSPGLGDDIQMMKAGILEIGDIFVINKIDQGETGHLERNLELVRPGREREGWVPAIIKTIAVKGSGIDELHQKIEEHRKYCGKPREVERADED
ncbi:MAG TPA: methylmalonyl Co-A mutase-associated GTPase MeaB [bacterium]|nr:methylmalonyl Co-A mutase-associated GTPase MeaB [bacterium]